jgi:hypothetical protein
MTSDEYSSVRQYTKENTEDLRYILRHFEVTYLRACAGAIHMRGLEDPEIDRVIEDLEKGREVLG